MFYSGIRMLLQQKLKMCSTGYRARWWAARKSGIGAQKDGDSWGFMMNYLVKLLFAVTW